MIAPVTREHHSQSHHTISTGRAAGLDAERVGWQLPFRRQAACRSIRTAFLGLGNSKHFLVHHSRSEQEYRKPIGRYLSSELRSSVFISCGSEDCVIQRRAATGSCCSQLLPPCASVSRSPKAISYQLLCVQNFLSWQSTGITLQPVGRTENSDSNH